MELFYIIMNEDEQKKLYQLLTSEDYECKKLGLQYLKKYIPEDISIFKDDPYVENKLKGMNFIYNSFESNFQLTEVSLREFFKFEKIIKNYSKK